jgi:hypothetical protein
MPSSGTLRLVALVRPDILEEHSASISSMCKLLITANLVPNSLILVTLLMEVLHSSEMLVPTRATWCNITEDSTLHKPWFDEGCSKLLDQRKQANLQWIHDPSEISRDNLNNELRSQQTFQELKAVISGRQN